MLQIAEESGVGVGKRWAVLEVVVAYLVSGGADCGEQVRVTQSALADKEERGVGVVALEDVQHLRREDGMRAVIEGKGDEGKLGVNAIENVGGEAFENGEGGERLDPENKKACC